MNEIKRVESKMQKVVAKNFKRERKEKGISIYKISDLTGVSSVTIHKLEEEGSFSMKTLAAVCYVLDIDAWVLFLEEV